MIVSNLNRFNVEGVSTAQYYILDTLNKYGAKTTKELAKMRGISQSGILKLTKRLLKKSTLFRKGRRMTATLTILFLQKKEKLF